MQIIPVIDLMGGLAVHAKEGHRQHYLPLVSSLCAHADPHSVIVGLLDLYPFQTIYLADLDALSGRTAQAALIADLKQAFAGLEFWVDSGWSGMGHTGFMDRYFSPVIGSESLEYDNLPSLREQKCDFILSLDVLNGTLLGPNEVVHHTEYWPRRVILMSLSHVGSGKGPDFERLQKYIYGYPGHAFIAAGGVRDEADLLRLATMGLSAVLMASALHDGRVNRAMIDRLTVDYSKRRV
ncbi:MAG: HisA/HisF-related TIM barrel protein [Methylococcaceae bacterium]